MTRSADVADVEVLIFTCLPSAPPEEKAWKKIVPLSCSIRVDLVTEAVESSMNVML